MIATTTTPSAEQAIRLDEASPFAATLFSSRDGEALTLSAATLTFTAGQASLPLTSDGVLLVVVQTGTVRILSDHGLLDAAPSDDGATDVIAGMSLFGEIQPTVAADGAADGTTIAGATGVHSITLGARF